MTTQTGSDPSVLLEARDVSKWYGRGDNRFQALDAVSLQVRRGESVAIVGKSGSGKSTLMHVLATLDSADSGSVLVDGTDVASLGRRELNRVRNRTFGFVFQQFFLDPSTSVLENVVLPLKIAGMGVRERRRRAREVLTSFDLIDKASNRATDLSGGQKQRVVLSRALVNDPQVVFADEPTGNLDSVSGRLVEDALFTLHRERGITLVLVTHDEELADRCDRRLQMRDGRLFAAEAVTA